MHDIAESQIREQRKAFSYNTVGYSLEALIQRINPGDLETTWDKAQQSKFVESMILGLPFGPIQAIEKDKRLAIINGQKRLRAAIAFASNELTLEGLEVLKKLNGFQFADLLPARQRQLKRMTLRVVEFSPQSDLTLIK